VEAGDSAAASISLPDSPSPGRFREVVLFAFDDWAFPFRHHVETRLFAAQKPRIVLRPGPPGSYDEALLYYGTTIRIGDTFHMWYNGNYGPPSKRSPGGERAHCCICYATSQDGVHWAKPELGLVELNGSKRNNIVNFPVPDLWSTCDLLYDPDAVNPDRRFKMAYEAGPHETGGVTLFCVAFSRDGLHWRPSPRNPVGPFLEMSGVTKLRGLYYVTGQTESDAWGRSPQCRLATFVSADFEHWSPTGAVGFERGPDTTGPSTDDAKNQYEEVHLGAAYWNRGNREGAWSRPVSTRSTSPRRKNRIFAGDRPRASPISAAGDWSSAKDSHS